MVLISIRNAIIIFEKIAVKARNNFCPPDGDFKDLVAKTPNGQVIY